MNIHFDPSGEGFLNEQRFFAIVERAFEKRIEPDWIRSCWQANGIEDSLGVDGFVNILNFAQQIVRVPFQIKSSEAGISRHYRKYKVAWVDALPFMIVNDEKSDDRIWQEFESLLIQVRRLNLVYRRIEEHLATNGAYYEERRYDEGQRAGQEQESHYCACC